MSRQWTVDDPAYQRALERRSLDGDASAIEFGDNWESYARWLKGQWRAKAWIMAATAFALGWTFSELL